MYMVPIRRSSSSSSHVPEPQPGGSRLVSLSPGGQIRELEHIILLTLGQRLMRLCVLHLGHGQLPMACHYLPGPYRYLPTSLPSAPEPSSLLQGRRAPSSLILASTYISVSIQYRALLNLTTKHHTII